MAEKIKVRVYQSSFLCPGCKSMMHLRQLPDGHPVMECYHGNKANLQSPKNCKYFGRTFFLPYQEFTLKELTPAELKTVQDQPLP